MNGLNDVSSEVRLMQNGHTEKTAIPITSHSAEKKVCYFRLRVFIT